MAFDFMNMFAPRGTPSGLDALLSADQRKLMGRNANLSAAAALLAASGPSRQRVGLGQALGSALQAGQQGYQQARAGSLQDLLLGEKLKEAQAARQVQQQVAGALTAQPSVLTPEQQALAAPGGQVGPTMQRAEMAAAMPQMTPNQIKATQYQNAADILAAAGRVTDAEKYQSMAEKLNPRAEVVGQPFEVTDATGKPILVQQFKDGKLQTAAGFGPKREVVLQNLNNQVVAIDKSKLRGNETFAVGMSPSEAANLRIAQGNLAVAQGGLALRGQEFARGAFDRVDTAEGMMFVPKTPGAAAMPVLGPDGKPVKGASGGQPTGEERKAATLLSRMQLAQTQMDQGAKGMPGFLTSVTPRLALPEERKKVEDAQMDFLDAALTLATGAAYTEFQLKGAMQSYFPKFGDSPDVLADKELRRQNLLEAARLSAGRMGGSVPALPAANAPQRGGAGNNRPSLNNIFGVQ
jgi:hypothetical protein